MLACIAIVAVLIIAAIERSAIVSHIDTVASELHARVAALEETVKGKL